MTCPRCGHEWDVSKGPCSRCGLLVRVPGRAGSIAHTSTPPQKEGMHLDGMPPGNNSQGSDLPYEQRTMQTDRPHTDIFSQKDIPSWPHPSSPPPASPDPLTSKAYQAPQAARPSRLVTDPLNQAEQRKQVLHSPSPSLPVSPLRRRRQSINIQPLMGGTLIHSGHYRLHEVQGRQEWSSGVYEVMWLGQDVQRSGAPVMIGELVMPDRTSMMMQSCCENATTVFTSIGRNLYVPTFWDAFSDQGRNFFIFELIEGESLLARMRRTGGSLPEQEVIECCLQMTEVLELLSEQSPLCVHGQIRPEYILGRPGAHYVLTNFSIVLAGGAIQLVSGTDRSRLSPYTAPELTRGIIDGRSDLYALVATAYHLVTGSLPTSENGSIPQAQQLNPKVSPQLNAILMKGLHPAVRQRYQRPVELRQELLALYSTSRRKLSAQDLPPTYREYAGLWIPGTASLSSQTAAGIGAPTAEDILNQERELLQRPEELPPMRESNDRQQATIWLVSIVVCLLIVVVLGRGFFS